MPQDGLHPAGRPRFEFRRPGRPPRRRNPMDGNRGKLIRSPPCLGEGRRPGPHGFTAGVGGREDTAGYSLEPLERLCGQCKPPLPRPTCAPSPHAEICTLSLAAPLLCRSTPDRSRRGVGGGRGRGVLQPINRAPGLDGNNRSGPAAAPRCWPPPAPNNPPPAWVRRLPQCGGALSASAGRAACPPTSRSGTSRLGTSW